MGTFEERIAKQEEIVKKLAEEHKRNASDELELKLRRQTDLLLQMKNAVDGKPKERSEQTAEVARIVALSRAVQQVDGEE